MLFEYVILPIIKLRMCSFSGNLVPRAIRKKNFFFALFFAFLPLIVIIIILFILSNNYTIKIAALN